LDFLIESKVFLGPKVTKDDWMSRATKLGILLGCLCLEVVLGVGLISCF